MSLTIIKSFPRSKGKLLTIKYTGTEHDILFTYHSIERCSRWNLRLEDVAESLLNPDEVLRGHSGRYIAHKVSKEHLIRAVYEYDGDLPVVITVYYPYSKRYYKGGGIYEDKIF